MTRTELSFTPDSRSVQGATYQFSVQPSGYSGQRGYTQQDSLTWKLDKIYQTKFSDVSPQLRRTLIEILVPDVPLMHRNLDILATANYIVYSMRVQYNMQSVDDLTPEMYNIYFNQLAWSIISDASNKDALQDNITRANFKVTLLRYIYYVWDHTSS